MQVMFKAHFKTDGDFLICDLNKAIDTQSKMYRGATVEYEHQSDDDEIEVLLNANGDKNACRRAVLDLLEHMMCSIRTHKYELVKELYDKFRSIYDYYANYNHPQLTKHYMHGNYQGTELVLDVNE